MCRTWFILRFPARDKRCRICSPEDASRGAVPVQDANRFRSANRVMSPTSARVLAAPEGPMPWISNRVEPRAMTMAFELGLDLRQLGIDRPHRQPDTRDSLVFTTGSSRFCLPESTTPAAQKRRRFLNAA